MDSRLPSFAEETHHEAIVRVALELALEPEAPQGPPEPGQGFFWGGTAVFGGGGAEGMCIAVDGYPTRSWTHCWTCLFEFAAVNYHQ